MHRQKTFVEPKATLYLVATPIGNLDDISKRALDTLKQAQIIYAEDTRTSAKLLKHYAIDTPLKSFHKFNEATRLQEILNDLKTNASVCLISDAGSPLISDPGENLIKAIKSKGYHVSAIPGPTALIPAVSLSEITTYPFLFYGFLPQKNSARIKALKTLASLPFTLIFYEAPHRLQATIKNIYEIFGPRKLTIARELTKIYEEIIETNLDAYEQIPTLKGEMVLIVEGAKALDDLSQDDMIDHIKLLIDDGLSEMEAIKKVAKTRSLKKNVVYMAYQRYKQNNPN